jgi:hypothetical protein
MNTPTDAVRIYQPFKQIHLRLVWSQTTSRISRLADLICRSCCRHRRTDMRFRPVRPNIYLPVIRFGVLISDWKYILAATLVGYLMPFFFRLKLGIVPLWFVTGIGSAAISYGFFRYTKVGRKPYWFQHSIKALFEGSLARRTFPADRVRRSRSQWLLTAK